MKNHPEACFHCAAPVPAGSDIRQQREDSTIRFCCHGCKGAYLLITGSGLDVFYQRRKLPDEPFKTNGRDKEYSPSQLDRHVYQYEESAAIDIIIDGIHCASCVWLNENIISRLPGVKNARVNYATTRARVLFDPMVVSPAIIFKRISELGYHPRPYSRSAVAELAEKEKKELLIRFGTAGFLTMQLMAYSLALYAGYFQGISPEIKFYLQLFSLLVTTPVVFYSGAPFLRGAWRALTNSAPNMELLIAIGALSSYFYSIYATFTGGEVYYETAAMIVTLILAGRLLENSAKKRAAEGVEQLLDLTAGNARRFNGTILEEVDGSLLQCGDLILVAAGERLPVDGTIIEGNTDIDESPATGEPLPVSRTRGDAVIAGSINLTGTVTIQCDHPQSGSFVARVARLVEEAQNRRAPIQNSADKAASFFVPVVLILGAATFLWHLHQGHDSASALMTALSVVVIACPCALGLATPTAILAGTGAAAKAGIIFKGGDILERLSVVDLAVLDKTGTITSGNPTVLSVHPAPGIEPEQLAAWAAAVEHGSLHPIGRAICRYAEAIGIKNSVARNVEAVAGGGVNGWIKNVPVAAGSLRYLQSLGTEGKTPLVDPPPGGTAVFVACSGKHAGVLVIQDQLREEAGTLTAYLDKNSIKSVLLSGDRQENVALAAGATGIGQAVGDMSPSGKAAFIEEMKKGGRVVVMAGDGINDAPALAAADIGCAIAGGTDIAMETSDLILARPDLTKLALGHTIAKETMKIIRQNLCWAFCYNIIGIPLAMTGRLTPVYAAAAMTLSSFCVISNSLRLRGKTHGE